MKVSSLSAVAVAVLVAAVGIVFAGSGTSYNDPIEVPGDNNKPIEVDNSTPPEWRYAYIHNDTGRPPDNIVTGEGKQPGESAKFLEVAVKAPTGDPGTSSSPARQQNRVVVNGVAKKNAQGQWESVAHKIEPADGGERVVVTLEPEVDYCTTIRVEYKVQVRRRPPGNPMPPWGPQPWLSDGSSNVNVNFNLLNGSAKPLKKAGTGDDTLPPDKEGTMRTIGSIFEGLEPPVHTGATDWEAGDSGEAAAPDLIYSERTWGWSIPMGTLRFYATGGASFSENSNLEVIARQETGEDAVGNFTIVVGTPTVVDGAIVVPISSRESNPLRRVVVMVRGALVNVPELSGGTMIGYVVGGTSAGSDASARIAPLVRVGGEASYTIFKSRADIQMQGDAEDPENVGLVNVGGLIHVARPYGTGVQQGYIDAIVISEPAAGDIRAGSFEITPVDEGVSFVASANTKLYVVNADDFSGVDGFEEGTIGVTARGALRITLSARSVFDMPLMLVILNPKLNLGAGPFYGGRNARAAIGGECLRGGFQRTVLLVETAAGTLEHNHGLPSTPNVATELTPLAVVSTE